MGLCETIFTFTSASDLKLDTFLQQLFLSRDVFSLNGLLDDDDDDDVTLRKLFLKLFTFRRFHGISGYAAL